MDNIVKIGVIGIGNMGSAHASCILSKKIEGAELIAVCDNNNQRIRMFSESNPSINCYMNYADMLDSEEINAVIIATPHPTHAEIAIASLMKGKHVMLEKPADISVSRVKQINEAAKISGKVFCVMFNQRTNILFQKAREIVKCGLLGELKRNIWIITNWYRTQHYYDTEGWRATWSGEGGGVLINQAPHNIDIWQWICGMPKSISAHCDIAKYHNIETEDDAIILANYDNNATGLFITSTGEFPGTNRLEISGTLGKLVLENETLKWWKLKENERNVCFGSSEGCVRIENEYSEFLQNSPESGHKGILQNFINAILYGEKLISPGSESINELEISNAAYLSNWNNNAVVELPLDSTAFDEKLNELISKSNTHKSNGDISLSKNYKERWKVQW